MRRLSGAQARLPGLPGVPGKRLAGRQRPDRRSSTLAGKDRMEVTGARWSLDGAEAILKLRALAGNGDLDDYLDFHFQQE